MSPQNSYDPALGLADVTWWPLTPYGFYIRSKLDFGHLRRVEWAEVTKQA